MESAGIIIAGQRVPVPDLRVVTFVDDPSWDFAHLKDPPDRQGAYVEDRYTAGDDRHVVHTLEDTQAVVDMVVLHADITADSRTCYQILQRRGFSTHFMIDGDGTIYQGTDVAAQAIHASSPEFRKNINNFSIGIDLNCLQVNLAGTPPPAAHPGDRRLSDLIEINNVPWRSWGYTDAQYTALIGLLKSLAAVLPKLKLLCPLTEDNAPIWSVVEKYTPEIGLYGHYHLTEQKFDPGPGFDWHRLVYGLTEESNHVPLTLADPTTGRDVALAGLHTDADIAAAARTYFEHTELAGKGGYYPVGLHGQWHGGVHLFAPLGTPVRVMADGVVVAARNAPPGPLGSANFVLVRHDVLFGDPSDNRRFVFFSLYMHLQQFAAMADEAPLWVTLGTRPDAPLVPHALPPDEDAPAETAPGLALTVVGDGIDALRRGEVALLPTEGPTARRVAAGAIVGHVGEVGDDDDREALLHLEVVANSQWRNVVDLLGVHGRFWTDVEADPDDNLVVDVESLWRQILPDRGHHRVRPDDIEALYAHPDDPEVRDRLRMAITRHVSEWSDQVDWVKLLATGQTWEQKHQALRDLLEVDGRVRDALFAREIARHLPFVWLTEDVAKHAGLRGEVWDGVLDHFHPIQFLFWLTFHSNARARELAKGKSRREIARERARADEKREAARLAGEWDDVHGDDMAPTALDDLGDAGEALEALWDAPVQPGEWRRD